MNLNNPRPRWFIGIMYLIIILVFGLLPVHTSAHLPTISSKGALKYKEAESIVVYNNIPMSEELTQYTIDTAEKYGLKPEVVFGVITVESNFHADADNGLCIGLMQINRCNQEWLRNAIGVTDLFDPEQNIEAGCFILKHHLDQGYNIEQALVCYNVGYCCSNSTYYSQLVLSYAEEYQPTVITKIST